jgi:hypothetical protein
MMAFCMILILWCGGGRASDSSELVVLLIKIMRGMIGERMASSYHIKTFITQVL